jgi:putative cardiolipin synthase
LIAGGTVMRWLRAGLLLLATCASGCASLSQAERAQAVRIASDARSQTLTCTQPDRCAAPSPLRDLGTRALAESAPQAPRHYALILDYGQDALVSRLDLFRGARSSIDLQTYIFDEDDAGRLVLEELLAAARRGVRVRVLMDQLSALKKVETLAALTGAHRNLEVRVYNPVLSRAKINYPQYVLAAACCWRRLNQRMHSKMLVIDGAVAITGGRNYQDDYYDWSDEYNFRDRDLMVAGPRVAAMEDNFEAFWNSRRSVPVEELADVGGLLLREGVPVLPPPDYARPQRVAAVSREADDDALIGERIASAALSVGEVEFLADLPEKHRESAADAVAPSTRGLRELIESASDEVLLQTPYLVLSKPAQQMFRELHDLPDGPDVRISTNSLAATDSFITYALAYKYKRRYLRDFGFHIHEFKPFPVDAPIDVDATGAVAIAWEADGTPIIDGQVMDDTAAVAPVDDGPVAGPPRPARDVDTAPRPLTREYSALRFAGINVNDRVPLKRAGVRIGLHAKSMVIDDRIGVVGTHNFDPRGDSYNTESAVVIEDPAFARQLATSIRRDMSPQNAWVIARRDKPPVFSGLEYSIAKVSEHLPVFDLWPMRYATSYEFKPGPECPMPLPADNPRFRTCYEPVGDFPEVDLGFKTLLTRIFTAFGAGLAPIL